MTIMLIMVAMIKTTMIKDNDKTRPARPLCPNHQNFPSHSNATPQMLPQKIVFLVEQFFPLNHCVRSERLNWCHKNSFLAPQVFPTDIFFGKHVTVVPTHWVRNSPWTSYFIMFTLPWFEARIYFKTFYCIGRPNSTLISKRLRIYDIGVCFEEN